MTFFRRLSTTSKKLSTMSKTASKRIKDHCETIAKFLIEKNNKYGNSALDPVRIFSKTDSVEQLKVRIDDKLNRLMNFKEGVEDEDVVRDLIGYLILLEIKLNEQPHRHHIPFHTSSTGANVHFVGDSAEQDTTRETHNED